MSVYYYVTNDLDKDILENYFYVLVLSSLSIEEDTGVKNEPVNSVCR